MKNSTKPTNSRFLSLILRHKPELIGLQLDSQGWVQVDTLLQALAAHGRSLSQQGLQEIVALNNKQRFAFDETGTKIRANQGHSVPIDLGYRPSSPPEILYHGTATRHLESILKQGLQKRNRHHVHLSDKLETAAQVGRRHGELVILRVASQEMEADGRLFFVSENGVWLTDEVPTQYISILE